MFNKEKIVEEYIREQIRNSGLKTAKENIHEIYIRVIKNFERYINVVVIKPSGKILQTKMRINNLEDFKKAVGGKFRPIPIGDYGLCLINDEVVNDKGGINKLPVNGFATLIYKKGASASGFMVGNVVCLGYANEDGEYVDISEKFVKFIEEISCVKLKSTVKSVNVEPVVEPVIEPIVEVFTEEEKIF